MKFPTVFSVCRVLPLVLVMQVFSSNAWGRVAPTEKNLQKSWLSHQQLRKQTPFHGLQWRNIGPVVQGGRVVRIVQDPTDSTHWFVAYASGGVWETRDNGITFSPLTDFAPSLIVGDFAINPENPQELWLGTGENNSSRSSYGGMGIFKSTDGGTTWQNMGLAESNRIGRIVIDKDNPQTVYAAALGPLYSAGGQRGIYKTTDGGKTWQQVLSGDKKTGFVDLQQASNGDLYAVAWERDRKAWNFTEGGPGSAVYKSSDKGAHWQKLTEGLPLGKYTGRMGVAVSPTDPDIVYVVVDNQEPLPESEWDLGDKAVTAKRLKKMSQEEFLLQDPAAIEDFLRANNFPPEMTAEKLIEQVKSGQVKLSDLVGRLQDANANLFNRDIKGLEVYRSYDGGQHFEKTHQQPLDNVVFTYGYYFGQVRIDPTNPDVIYTMGVPLIKSTDGGRSWQSLYDPKVHADFHELWIDPADPRHLRAGNDGGVDESYDGGGHWRKLDYQPVGQFYSIAVDNKQPYNVYGGLQDNGTLTGSSQNDWQNGESWRQLFGGDGMQVNIDPRDNTKYVGFQFGNYYRLDKTGSHPIQPHNYIGQKEPLRFNWNSPLKLSSHNPDVLYFGANKLFRSLNRGDDWQAISKDLSNGLRPGDVPFGTITSIAESPKVFGRLWAGTDDGNVWFTPDGGYQWKKVTRGLPKGLWVSRVAASPHDKNRVWLGLNNYRNDDLGAYVYRSDDAGKHWHRITTGLPQEPVNVIMEDPNQPGLVYVGTDKGAYVSTNYGESWSMLSNNLPTVPVHDLALQARDRELVAGTHGRSAWVLDVAPLEALASEKKDLAKQALYLFEPKPVAFKKSWRSRPSRWYQKGSEEKPLPVYFWVAPQALSRGEATARLTVLDANQQPLLRTEIPVQAGINRWDWNKQVDATLALAAEKFANRAASAPLNKSKTPYAEARRLGHRFYIQPGKYTVQVQLGEASSEQPLVVNGPKNKKKPSE
jgi:photosystem II stability/assembly factor-like uncharacterized protein